MRVLLRRPPLHHAIIVGYILAPFVNVALLLAFTGLPLELVLRRFVAGYGPLASLWLVTAPLAGIGLYFVHRASWYIFVGHSSLILVDFALKWIIKPRFYYEHIPTLNNVLIFVGNLALVAAIGYLINRDFRAPYFQALRRSWRESVRIPMRHEVSFGGEKRQIDDISAGGCFLVGVDAGCALGDQRPVSFALGRLQLQCSGEVMRITDRGCGVRFVGLAGRTRRKLAEALRHRFVLRYQVDLPAGWEAAGSSVNGRVWNLSAGGCYIAMETAAVAEGSAGVLHVLDTVYAASVAAHVVWVNPLGEHGKPPGCGLQFKRSQAALVRRLVQAGNRTLTR